MMHILAIILLIAFGLWLAFKAITRPGKPVEIITGDFTIQQLNQFDGIRKPQNFIALKGTIYDVSGSWFYKKSGPYGKFAGHDASINLAKMSHDDLNFDKWGQISITPEQQKVLNQWVEKFEKKYRKVGNVSKRVLKQVNEPL